MRNAWSRQLAGLLALVLGLGCQEDSSPSEPSNEPPVEVEPTFCEHEVEMIGSYAFDDAGFRYKIAADSKPVVPGGTSVAFEWVGLSCVGTDTDGSEIERTPTGYRYRLRPLEIFWNNLGPEVTQVTYPAAHLHNRSYEFEVAAINERQAFGPSVKREFEWNAPPETQLSQFLFPGETEPQSVIFAAPDDGRPFEEYEPVRPGDTLAVSVQGISIWTRPEGMDPDGPPGADGIRRMQVRLLDGPGLWQEVAVGERYTADGIYTEDGTSGYVLTARVMDQYERWDATPDSIRFYVNFAPRFLSETTIGGEPFIQRPLGDEVLPLESLRSSTELDARFAAHDPDPIAPTRQLLEFSYRFASFPGPKGERFTSSFQTDWQQGNFRDGTWEPTLSIERGRHEFYPGEFELVVWVRESLPQTLSVLGYRLAERRIRFRIE